MVLAELGAKITNAIRTMTSKTVIDEETVDAMLKEIGTALLSADVNVRLVATLRKNIKASIDFDQMASGINKRRVIQKVPSVPRRPSPPRPCSTSSAACSTPARSRSPPRRAGTTSSCSSASRAPARPQPAPSSRSTTSGRAGRRRLCARTRSVRVRLTNLNKTRPRRRCLFTAGHPAPVGSSCAQLHGDGPGQDRRRWCRGV
jgi:hypothetical protein